MDRKSPGWRTARGARKSHTYVLALSWAVASLAGAGSRDPEGLTPKFSELAAEITPADTLEHPTISVDIADSWTLAARMHFGDPDKAAAFNSATSARLHDLSMGAITPGVPESKMKTLRFGQADKGATVSPRGAESDVSKMTTMDVAAMSEMSRSRSLCLNVPSRVG